MADNEQECSVYQHSGTLALLVEECSEERSDEGCSDREPSEDVGSRLRCYSVKVALEHIGPVTLEWENGRIVENAQKRHYPEAARRKDLAQIGDFELVLRVALGSLFAGSDELCIELPIHHREHEEVNQTDEQQASAYSYRRCDGAQFVCDDRAN